MKTLFPLSIAFFSLLSSAYGSSLPTHAMTNCDYPTNVYLYINGDMPNATISSYSGYFGEGGIKFGFSLTGQNIPGNTPQLSTTYTSAICMKQSKHAIFTAITQVKTGLSQSQTVDNSCLLKIHPKDISDSGGVFNLYLKWDPANQVYHCSTKP